MALYTHDEEAGPRASRVFCHAFQMQRMSEVPLAAVVVEGRHQVTFADCGVRRGVDLPVPRFTPFEYPRGGISKGEGHMSEHLDRRRVADRAVLHFRR